MATRLHIRCLGLPRNAQGSGLNVWAMAKPPLNVNARLPGLRVRGVLTMALMAAFEGFLSGSR